MYIFSFNTRKIWQYLAAKKVGVVEAAKQAKAAKAGTMLFVDAPLLKLMLEDFQ